MIGNIHKLKNVQGVPFKKLINPERFDLILKYNFFILSHQILKKPWANKNVIVAVRLPLLSSIYPVYFNVFCLRKSFYIQAPFLPNYNYFY